MGVAFNPRSELAQLFSLSSGGYAATALDIFQQLKNQRDYFGSDSQDPMVHESLAPSFGTLDNAVQSVKELDDKLKFMIAFSLKELLKYKQNGALNWENIERCFSANTYLVSMEQPQEITKQYISESSSDFHFDGSPDPSLVQKVMNWWQSEACPDPDIRNDSRLDVESLAKTVAWSGATVTNFLDF